MWRCSSGDKVLSGPLLGVFLLGFELILDQLSEDWEDVSYHLDKIPKARRLDVMAYLAEHLILKAKGETPEHTAWAEGVIHDIFQEAATYWDMMSDGENFYEDTALARQLFLEGYEEYTAKQVLNGMLGNAEPESELGYLDRYKGLLTPYESCDWDDLAESLVDGILWDRDFDMGHLAQLPVELYAKIDAQLGLGADYYSTPLPVYTKAQRDAIFKKVESAKVQDRARPSAKLLKLDSRLVALASKLKPAD